MKLRVYLDLLELVHIHVAKSVFGSIRNWSIYMQLREYLDLLELVHIHVAKSVFGSIRIGPYTCS